MSQSPAQYSVPFTVRIDDAGPDRQGSVACLSSFFQEAAAIHARALDFSGRRMGEINLAWVVARLRIETEHYPCDGDQVRVLTWPSACEKFRAHRQYELYDAADRLLARGLSTWIAMDKTTRRVAPLPSFIIDNYPASMPSGMAFPCKNLPRMPQAGTQALLNARASDVDINGHVNNVRFLEWILESMPPSHASRQFRPASLDIAFRAECRKGDTVASRTSPAEEPSAPQTFLHSLARQGDDQELARAVTTWATD